MCLLLKKSQSFCSFYFFVNVITSNRNQLELAQEKMKTYWKSIRLSHGIQEELNYQTGLWKGRRQGSSGDPDNSCSQIFPLEFCH